MDATQLPGHEQLYDAAPCGLLLASADGTVLDVNATLCHWLHCRKHELLGKTRFPDLLSVGGRIFWQTHLHPLLRMQSSVAEVKLELRRGDGQLLPVIVNAAERAWQGQVLLHLAVFIAEDRHKYERELLLQRQRAEELAAQHASDQQALAAAQAQALDRATFAEQLVGMVSHDIRNPLSVIHMSAALLERGVGAEQQKAAVARISRAVQRVQHLIGDLLDFTQARVGGGLSLKKQPDVDLHQAVADAVAELAIAFPQCTLRHERAGKTSAGSNGQNGGNGEGRAVGRCFTGCTAQQRIRQRHDRGPHTYCKQAGNQRPEVQSGFPDRPDPGKDEDESKEKRAGRLAQQDQQAGNDQRDTGRDEIGAAAKRNELPAANGEEQARSDDDRAKHQQP